MRNKSSILITLLLSAQALAVDILPQFKQMVATAGVGGLSAQSYCHRSVGETIKGYRTNSALKIASVTKLYATLLAVRELDLNKQYETTFWIQDDKLHIQGGKDPYFEEDKILFMIQALNELGYKSFSQVTFDDKFLATHLSLGEYAPLTTDKIQQTLNIFFNTAKYPNTIKNYVDDVNDFIEKDGVSGLELKIPEMKATSVAFSNTNPFLLNGFFATKLVHKSKPLHSIIKSMNVMSKNWVAQNLWGEVAAIKKPADVLTEAGVFTNTVKIYTGSGLPIKNAQGRTDNTATCNDVLNMLDALKRDVEAKGFRLTELIGHGQDLGSYTNRFLLDSDLKDSILSKTGTLSISAALAGWLATDTPTTFAIVNHTSNVKAARTFQDKLLSLLLDRSGGGNTLDYLRLSIFPLDSAQFF